MKYKLLIFDLDGTLLDTEAHIISCFQKAAGELNLPVPEAVRVRRFIGLGAHKLLQSVYEDNTQIDYSALVDRYRYHYFTAKVDESYFFPGAIEALHAFHQRGYLLGIATGKSRRGINEVLEVPSVAGLFVTSRGAEETSSKPDPQMLLEILDEVQIPPAEAVLIGDTEYDLQMANNAKMDGVGVTCGVHSRELLLACAPVACVDDVSELLTLFN